MAIDGNTLRELAIKVSQYFLDFLESDFKRQQAPRRRIVLQTDGGFRAGMKVAPYPSLQTAIWNLLQKPVGQELSFKLQPRAFTRPITATLRGIIREQINALSDEALATVRVEVLSRAQTSRGRAIENPEVWVDELRAVLADEVATQIVRPLLALLDGPLSNQAYSVQDSIFSAESELIEAVASNVDAVLPDELSKYLATGDPSPLEAALEEFLTAENTRQNLMQYFENYISADAFLEFRDLESFAATGENLQSYLYLGALRFGNLSFPLFYIPLDIQRLANEGGYAVTLVNHLYTNKRAIDFVLQEMSERQKRAWLSPVTERISYLAPEQTIAQVAESLFTQIANAMDLGGQISLTAGAVREASNTNVLMSSALHIAVFDRSDEALLNDYEEMIKQARNNEQGVVELFEGIVHGVLIENPVSIADHVEHEWDQLPLVDRVVIDSPVPLNEEQAKILSAIRNPIGKIVVVEGPPGTGKSHTITAIAADCALRNRSCLVLSDKTEALDVVQNKLADAMNQVRHDKNFPNPILRLGQDQANFKRLTSNQSLTQVSAYVKASKANQPRLNGELLDSRNKLKKNISDTINTLGRLPLAQIGEVFEGEHALEEISPGLVAELRMVANPELIPVLERAIDQRDGLAEYLSSVFADMSSCTAAELSRRLRRDAAVVTLATAEAVEHLAAFERLEPEDIRRLSAWILEYQQLRMPVFGYLFRGGAVRTIERRINGELPARRALLLKTDANALTGLLSAANALKTALPAYGLTDDHFSAVYELISANRLPPQAAIVAHELVQALGRQWPTGLPSALFDDLNPHRGGRIWVLAIVFLKSWIPTSNSFGNAPEFDYVSTKSHLERLNVAVMNTEIDNRLVSFMNNFRADAKTLASVISNRQKFPEDKFNNVKESFPIILASIRQFGEYMPLAPDLFDVVVIDEASQVSVAQAFPALLRAKKVVVLGDSKQFSNTKSSNASIALNDKYRSDLEAFFRQRVSQEASMLQRLARFDVKCSILDFCQLCANYSSMLRKHFRSYQELISYSSSTFYGGQLQAIKIRGVPLDDVIRFDIVDSEAGKSSNGTNQAEVDFILERLLELLEEEDPPTVGVITPHREQQTLLTKKLFGHPQGMEFQDKLRLKVMTFDSCQGEERKIIFYSMVASRQHDALNYIFPVELSDAEEKVEEKLKMQRLNVGFSRAEELVWFVLSKPIDEFKGSIAKALQHYANILKRGEVDPDRTDPNSPMEKQVLDWLQKTPFYQSHQDEIEILPQFPIGDYLRQLDPTYQHPSWRVDFLLTFSTAKGTARIVVEYDGFDFHFAKGKPINVGNHELYLNEADIERQLTLESYGYRFLRVNRFNLGRDPIQTLSDRLARLVERLFEDERGGSMADVQKMASGIASKELKPCSRCKEIRPQEAFYDRTLKGGEGGYGRVCTTCKAADAKAAAQSKHSGSRRGRRWRRRR